MPLENHSHEKSALGILRPLAIYIGTSLATLQGADTIIDHLAFPPWLFTACLAVLVLGLPLVAATAYVQQHTLAVRLRMPLGRVLTWRNALSVGVFVFALLGLATTAERVIGAMRGQTAERTRADLLQLQRLVEVKHLDTAWIVAQRLQKVIPNDSVLKALEPAFTDKLTMREPVGVTVYRRFYSPYAPGDFERVGTIPFDNVKVPSEPSWWRLQRGNRVLAEFARPPVLMKGPLPIDTAAPPDMIHIRSSPVKLFNAGLYNLPPITLGDYLLDRYETTNAQYKRFIDAGGYRRPEFWTTPFKRGQDVLTFEQAMRVFVDRTGRPGPSTWEAGDYPEKQGDYPVSGVSWYEAGAYARYMRKDLPTLYHWLRASPVNFAGYIVPASNFSKSGTVRVGSMKAISHVGAYDMAGNVREWCFNAWGDQRYIVGGSYRDDPYEFTEAIAQPAWDRSPTNGIRLAKYLDTTGVRLASRPVIRAFRDYRKERPVSDAVFAVFKRLYEYDRRPLEAKTDAIDSTTSEHFVQQRVSYDAGYGNARLITYIFLPRNMRPPYQVVIYFPGSYGIGESSSKNIYRQNAVAIDYIVKSGRAFILPVYRGMFERQDGLASPFQVPTAFWREHVISFVTEVRRTIDYVEQRADLDEQRVAYYGYSWGGYFAGIIPALEPRIKVVIAYVAGLHGGPTYPEVDPFNFLPRVKQPLLYLNGRNDFFFPVEVAQKPWFDNLGTPAGDKRTVLFEGWHDAPRDSLISETLTWLDKYLGPVQSPSNM